MIVNISLLDTFNINIGRRP